MSDFMIQRTFTGETAIKDMATFMAAVGEIGGEVQVPAYVDGVWNFGSLPIRLAGATPIDDMTLRSVMVGGKRLMPGIDSTIEVKALITDHSDEPADSHLPIELDDMQGL
jgi:hypothetical protein